MYNAFGKRICDFILSALGLAITSPIIIIFLLLSASIHGGGGLFVQTRVGKNGKHFLIFKIKSMHDGSTSSITVYGQGNISKLGQFIRKNKIDELPQLVNVFFGQMSLVGPRPDVPEMYENLNQELDPIFSAKPGITGPAQLLFRDEEAMLAQKEDPEAFYRDVIWKKKLQVNRKYVANMNFCGDMMYIIKTVL